MRGHAETKEERRGQSNAGTPKEPSLLESVAHNARAAASSLQRNIVNDSNNAAHVPSQQELPGDQLRRTSLGLFGPDVFFNLSDHQHQQLDHRRSSLGFGGDFDFQGQHQQQLQQQQVQNGTTASTLSIDSAGLGPTANAYFVQGGFEQTANNNAPVYPQQRAFFGFGGQQQQQQSQQNISASDRVRAEAQAAAAAIFLGGPLPGSNDDNENSNQRQNQNFFGAVPLQNALPNNSQQFGRMRQLYSNTRNDNNTSSQCDISSLSMNGPQIQQQRNLTHHSLDMSRIQQLQQQLQYQQQQQLQQQQQQQQIMGRHSFGLPMTPSDAPFQQVQRGPQQVQASFSISDQLRQHQQHLEELNRGPASADAAATSSEQQDKPESLRIKKGKKKSIKSSPDVASPSSFTGGKKDPPFPQKLHEILSNPEYEEIICWMPHGKSWRILKPTAFEHQVIPLHFRHSKYASFMRQVNGWGFERVMHGNDHNAYRHDLFLRDQPELCKRMKRIGTVKNNIKLTKPFDDEANNEQAKDTAEGGAPVRRRRPSQPGSSTEMLGGNELLTSFGDTDNNLMSAADSSSALSNNFSGSSRDRSGSNQLNTDAWTSAMQSFQNTGRIDTNAMMPPSMNQLSTLQQQMGAHKSTPGLTPGQQNQMSLQDRLNAITDSGGVMNFAAMQLLAGGLGSGQNNSQQGLGNFDVLSSNTLGSGRTSNPQQQQGQQHQQSSSEQKGEGDEVLE